MPNRNTESHFALVPRINVPRSRFDRSFDTKFSGNVGQLIPFYCEEVLPADTFSVDSTFLVRFSTLKAPIMDNIYLDKYYFFVPNRLVWEHWRELMGENTKGHWTAPKDYRVPVISLPPDKGFAIGSLADFLDVPPLVKGMSGDNYDEMIDNHLAVNALPFRAYGLIYNEWFRDENLSDPLPVPLDDADVTGVSSITGNYMTDTIKGGPLVTVSKYHDYFTSSLPEPQKGISAVIPIGGVAPVSGTASISGNLSTTIPKFSGNVTTDLVSTWVRAKPTSMIKGYTGIYPDVSSERLKLIDFNNKPSVTRTLGAAQADPNDVVTWSGGSTEYGLSPENLSLDNTQANGKVEIPATSVSMSPVGLSVVPDKLVADLGAVSGIDINTLRQAVAVQHLLEADARGGTRYTEILTAHFGVTSPDARLQRPEYLGGNRVPININQVVQMSGDTESTKLGSTAAYSLTVDEHEEFVHSFTEHGWILGLCCVRYDHSYQQGLPRSLTRTKRLDYYWPELANLSEQPVYNSEIYLTGVGGSIADNKGVFGYQEAYADYRYKPNTVHGEMRSQYAQSLDVWHLGDDYDALPTLSDGWIHETKNNVDRVLAVTSEVSNQFIVDAHIRNWATRAMPMYSVPGLRKL